ncbi:MAG: YkgJ family cysteine cluster protein [Acidobacteria bacterium]|nr:YkgJ family cysteine cluster protein [Acidobacteriota bacterium]
MRVHNLPEMHERLELPDTFQFSCRKELSCFGSCCRNRVLTLTPYDVLRLKNNLRMHSDDFLTRHTEYSLDPATGFPLISIKLGSAPEKLCPFLISEGCSVYEDRPTVCRLFPLARVSGFEQDSKSHDEFFYALSTPGCLGRMEERMLTVGQWLSEQGMDPYRAANDSMLHLLFHPGRSRDRALNEKQLQKILVSLYNLDVFREFVLKTNFMDAYSIDTQTQSRIENDDQELLRLGFSFLRTDLFT